MVVVEVRYEAGVDCVASTLSRPGRVALSGGWTGSLAGHCVTQSVVAVINAENLTALADDEVGLGVSITRAVEPGNDFLDIVSTGLISCWRKPVYRRYVRYFRVVRLLRAGSSMGSPRLQDLSGGFLIARQRPDICCAEEVVIVILEGGRRSTAGPHIARRRRPDAPRRAPRHAAGTIGGAGGGHDLQ